VLWNSPAAEGQRAAVTAFHEMGVLPFDHDRRMISTVVRDEQGVQTLVSKGAPETVLQRCAGVPAGAQAALDAEFAAGNRVVAVATRPALGIVTPTVADERELTLVGLLVFLDAPKRDAAEALRRLADLGVTVKVVTGDSPAVAVKVCRDLGLTGGGALTGRVVASGAERGLCAARGEGRPALSAELAACCVRGAAGVTDECQRRATLAAELHVVRVLGTAARARSHRLSREREQSQHQPPTPNGGDPDAEPGR